MAGKVGRQILSVTASFATSDQRLILIGIAKKKEHHLQFGIVLDIDPAHDMSWQSPMDQPSDIPVRPTPPPPDIPRYTPPVPSILIPTVETTVAQPPSQLTPKLKLRVAQELEIHISPHGALAPFNTRVIAAGIDGLLALGLSITAWVILPGTLGTSLLWLLGPAYLVTRDSLPFLGGQSIGKKAMHLQALTLDGESLAGNWQPGLLRNVALAIPLFAFVELFILLTREDKPEHGRRLGDEWANTKVIVVQPANNKTPTDR